MDGARQSATVIVASVAVHLGVLALALVIPAVSTPGEAAAPVDAIEVELYSGNVSGSPGPGEDSPGDSPASPPSPEPAKAHAAAAAESPAGAAEAPPSAAAAIAEAPSSGAPGPAPEAPASPGAAPGSLPAPGAPDEYGPPGGAPVLPGIGGTPVWSVPGAIAAEAARPAPTGPASPAPTPRDVAGDVLRGTLQKRDKELGLQMPSAGVVAGAIADLARTAEIAGDARATFEVSLGAAGEVQGIRVLSFSAGDNGTWQRVAKGAASSLAGRGLAGTGEPATVIVKVESTKRYPAGSKEKMEVKPVCVNEVIEDVAKTLAAAGTDQAEAPPERPATLDPRRRVCIPVAVGGVGDASNAGAHKINVVKSSFQVVRRGDRNLPANEVKPMETRAKWLQPRDSREAPPPKKKKPKKKKP